MGCMRSAIMCECVCVCGLGGGAQQQRHCKQEGQQVVEQQHVRTCAPSRRGEAWACSTGREVAGGLPAMRCGGRGGGRPPPPVLMLGRMPSPIASSPLTDLPDPPVAYAHHTIRRRPQT